MSLPLRDTAIPDSPLARWDARWKLAALTLATVAVTLLRHPTTAAVAFAFTLVVALVGRVPVPALLARLGVLLVAVLPVMILLPLTTDGVLSPALAVVFRTLAIGTLAVVLVRTAPLAHTFAAAHALKVPGVLVLVAQLAHRYALLFLSETQRLRIAMLARGFRPRTNAHTYRTLGGGVGTLVARGGDRAERVADAMRARGFDGTFRTVQRFTTTSADIFTFALLLLPFAGLVAWDRLA